MIKPCSLFHLLVYQLVVRWPPSPAAGVELGEEAVVYVSSLSVQFPKNDTEIREVRLLSSHALFQWTTCDILTSLSASVPVPCCFCPCCVSAVCSFAPAAAPITKPHEQSPLECDRVAPLLASSPVPTSVQKHTQSFTSTTASSEEFKNCTFHLFLFYVFLLDLMSLDLNDLLQALWRGAPLTAEAWYSHHTWGGFIIFPFLLPFLFLLCNLQWWEKVLL